jgi:hypothetical protein
MCSESLAFYAIAWQSAKILYPYKRRSHRLLNTGNTDDKYTSGFIRLLRVDCLS